MSCDPSPSLAPTLGIYLQVPFCASKCSFCNFSSRVERAGIFNQYARLLQREVQTSKNLLGACGIPGKVFSFPVNSIYMGGGTPTLLGGERLAAVAGSLRDRFTWNGDVEFTVEATPGSADQDLLRAMKAMGVNRLSIGAQTFDDQELRAVGRLHTAEDTCEMVRQARQAGFRNVSLDLIAGLPHQTMESFRRSLESAARLGPEHVSLYLFEADEKSRLGREVVHGGNRYHAGAAPGDEFMADAYEAGCAFLEREGLIQYEVSNFARPGFESRHNRKYWQLEPYLGYGAGAHSFDGERRWSNVSDVQIYMAKLESGESAVAEARVLSREEQVEEFFFIGLRQTQGVNLEEAKDRWGANCLAPWESKIQTLIRDGWVLAENGQVRLAPYAYLVSNEIFQEFVSI